ncbi:MAG: UbiA family prenyltransferase [Candidatus Eisenbacteria bacterium]|jgi:4-hydroxybenzoate polyprenyltransferase|nr:UbiA family prenyltransferase [Candidatus Eisenbacteria bacterium]
MPVSFSLTASRFWSAYWITMRPYLLFVSGVAGMVGIAASGAGLIRSVAAFAAFLLSYGFGQALTDCFQTDTDSLSSPYRPLVRGIVSRADVLRVSLAGLALCSVLLIALNPWAIIPACMAVSGLATYTHFKRRWWAGPWYNAWIVALLPLMGRLAGGGAESAGLVVGTPPLIPFILSVFFGYTNFVLMGYFKDISADRASGYDTFVVRFGWIRAAVGTDVLSIATVAASAWGFVRHGTGETVPAALVLIAGWVVLLAAQIGIHRVRTEQASHGPIANVVRGFVLVHIAAAILFRPAWLLAAALFYAAFELALATRPERSQV